MAFKDVLRRALNVAPLGLIGGALGIVGAAVMRVPLPAAVAATFVAGCAALIVGMAVDLALDL